MSELGIVMPSRYQLTDKLSPDSIYAYYGVDNVRHKEVAMKIYGNLFAKNMELIKSVWSELFITRMICLDGSHPNVCTAFVSCLFLCVCIGFAWHVLNSLFSFQFRL